MRADTRLFQVISAHNPAYWKMILFFCPILGAVLIAGALTIDECEFVTKLHLPNHSQREYYHVADHNWYDVVFGGMIGTFTALIAFRQTFASIFDFRFNHVLLPRTTSLFRLVERCRRALQGWEERIMHMMV